VDGLKGALAAAQAAVDKQQQDLGTVTQQFGEHKVCLIF
jgi:hypothetical protein